MVVLSVVRSTLHAMASMTLIRYHVTASFDCTRCGERVSTGGELSLPTLVNGRPRRSMNFGGDWPICTNTNCSSWASDETMEYVDWVVFTMNLWIQIPHADLEVNWIGKTERQRVLEQQGRVDRGNRD